MKYNTYLCIMKTIIDFKLRLRQDSGNSNPSYTKDEIVNKLLNNTARFEQNTNNTIFIIDSERNNKIMDIVE